MSELSKEELIEVLKINEISCTRDGWDLGYNAATRIAIDLAKQLPDTPKKVVVPKHVADWFEKKKNDLEFNIWRYIKNWEDQDYESEFFKFMNDNNGTNPIGTLIKMKLYGYEVEQPKRYRVKLPLKRWNEDKAELEEYIAYLALDITSDESLFVPTDVITFEINLTEEQIKSIDERYWSFAELIGGEVEEVPNES